MKINKKVLIIDNVHIPLHKIAHYHVSSLLQNNKDFYLSVKDDFGESFQEKIDKAHIDTFLKELDEAISSISVQYYYL